MTTKEGLIKAKEFIDTPDKWCQHAFSEHNRLTGTTKYCSMGALDECIWRYARGNGKLLANMSYKLECAIDGLCIGPWNDSHTHAQVMEAWDRAIAEAN